MPSRNPLPCPHRPHRAVPALPARSSLLALLVLPAWVAAQTAPPAAPPTGRLLASNCAQCHGTNGKGPGFERLAGESAREIYSELKEMQSGKEGSGLMTQHAKGYTDAQLRALADYLSKQR